METKTNDNENDKNNSDFRLKELINTNEFVAVSTAAGDLWKPNNNDEIRLILEINVVINGTTKRIYINEISSPETPKNTSSGGINSIGGIVADKLGKIGKLYQKKKTCANCQRSMRKSKNECYLFDKILEVKQYTWRQDAIVVTNEYWDSKQLNEMETIGLKNGRICVFTKQDLGEKMMDYNTFFEHQIKISGFSFPNKDHQRQVIMKMMYVKNLIAKYEFFNPPSSTHPEDDDQDDTFDAEREGSWSAGGTTKNGLDAQYLEYLEKQKEIAYANTTWDDYVIQGPI